MLKRAKSVVMNHDQIAMEDFKAKFFAKTTMTHKHGRELQLVDPRWTTMDCFQCGAMTKHYLALFQRTYTCESCGLVSAKDKNFVAVMVVRAGFNPVVLMAIRPSFPLGTKAAKARNPPALAVGRIQMAVKDAEQVLAQLD